MKKIESSLPLPLYLAASAKERRRGLLRQEMIDFALLIPLCPVIHTFAMREAIDVVFLRKDVVQKIYPNVSPGRFRAALALDCLELAAGEAARLGIYVGQKLDISR